MNKLILVVLCLSFKMLSLAGINKFVANSDTIPLASFDSVMTRDINKSAFEMFFTLFSDSINNAVSYKSLPQFLKDPNFDYHNSNFWFPPQSQISLRNLIILRVCNCQALKYLIRDKSNVYKKKPGKIFKVNLSDFSFFDLAQKRYFSLECDR